MKNLPTWTQKVALEQDSGSDINLLHYTTICILIIYEYSVD